MIQEEPKGKLEQPTPVRATEDQKPVDEADEMLNAMSAEDIKEAITILQGKARSIMKDAEGYNMYLASDRQNRYTRDYELIQAARARKQREANILLKHVKKLNRRLCELEGRPVPLEVKRGATGGAEQVERLQKTGIAPDADAYKE